MTRIITHLLEVLRRHRTARDVRELRAAGIRRRKGGVVYREME